MRSQRRLKHLFFFSIFAASLVFSRYGLAASSLVPETGMLDAPVHSPITANDLKPSECASFNLQTIITGSGAFNGTEANDLILGSAGQDEVDSLAGDDCLLGGDGNDFLFGGASLNTISVLDQFNQVSYANNDGTTNWSGDWQETEENDGPTAGDVVVEIPQTLGSSTQYADQDTTIEENHPDSNFGTTLVGKVKGRTGDQKRSLYHFDLSTIPSDAVVISASVSFFVTKSDTQPVFIHRITADWTESGANWKNSANLFSPTPDASFTPSRNNQYISTDITTLVQQWAAGIYPNQGLMLIASPQASESRYSSREETGSAQDPYLTYVLAPNDSAQSLRLQNSTRGAWRQVNLSSAQSALLQFDTLRQGLDEAADYVSIEISGDSGLSWTELARFSGPANDSQFFPSSFDISSFRFSDTRIRFLTSITFAADNKVYIDNIQISFSSGSFAGISDVLLGGGGDDTLDGGDGTDICYGGEGSDIFLNCETVFDP